MRKREVPTPTPLREPARFQREPAPWLVPLPYCGERWSRPTSTVVNELLSRQTLAPPGSLSIVAVTWIEQISPEPESGIIAIILNGNVKSKDRIWLLPVRHDLTRLVNTPQSFQGLQPADLKAFVYAFEQHEEIESSSPAWRASILTTILMLRFYRFLDDFLFKVPNVSVKEWQFGQSNSKLSSELFLQSPSTWCIWRGTNPVVGFFSPHPHLWHW